MEPSAVDALVKSAPIFGPIVVLQFVAIGWLAKAFRETLNARVSDAQETTKTLVAVNGSTTQALTGLTTGLAALKESHDEMKAEVRDATASRRTR